MTTSNGLDPPRSQVWPWVLAATSTALVVLSIRWAHAVARVVADGEVAVIDGVVAATVPWIGALLVSRQPRHRVGWILLAQASLGFAFATDVWALRSEKLHTLPLTAWAAWVSDWAWLPFLALPTLLVLWFPTGKPPSGRWRIPSWGVVSLLGVDLGLSMLGPRLGHHRLANPLWASAPPWTTAARDATTAALGLSALLVCFPAAFVRWRGSGAVERQQLRWFVASLVLVPVLFFAPLPYPMSDIAGGTGLLLVAVAVAIAVLRYRLYDLDVVVNRTVVYAGTTAVVVAIYAAAVWALNQALADRAGSLVAAIGVAAVFNPIRSRVQRSADHLLFGDRSDPYVALVRLGQRLEGVGRPDELAAAAAADIRRALRVPHVRIATDHLQPIDDGEPTRWGPPLSRVLSHQGSPIGRLEVSTRHPGDAFTASEIKLLDDLGRHLGTVLHAARVTGDLQRSRERLVAAREEERQRLHRDLHDGLGPTLGAAVLALDGIRTSLPSDSDAAERVEAVKRELQEAVGEVRRVVYELRPPALDELGLVGALDRHVRRLAASDRGPRVILIAEEDLRGLPPAVEVAVYRLVSEALANALRHAEAREVTVELTLDGELEVRIRDDGSGLPDDLRVGVGLRSMRERAEELGGTLEIRSTSQGTVITGRLPLGQGTHLQ